MKKGKRSGGKTRRAAAARQTLIIPRVHGATPLSERQASFIECGNQGTSADRQVGNVLNGHVAEWLRTGLQNRVPRFNSGRGLHQLFQELNARFVRFKRLEARAQGLAGDSGCCRSNSAGRPCLQRFGLDVAALKTAIRFGRSRRPACTTGMAARNMPLRSAAACQPITVSMGRRGNLYDNATAEIFMKKTLEVEALCLR